MTHKPARGYYIAAKIKGETRYFNALRNQWKSYRSKHTRFPSYRQALSETSRIARMNLISDNQVPEIVEH